MLSFLNRLKTCIGRVQLTESLVDDFSTIDGRRPDSRVDGKVDKKIEGLTKSNLPGASSRYFYVCKQHCGVFY